MAIIICSKNNYKDYVSPKHLALTITEDLDDDSVKVYDDLIIPDTLKSYLNMGEIATEYSRQLLIDLLHTTECEKSLHVLKELSIDREVYLICDNLGDIYFSSIIANALEKIGGVVRNYVE